MSTTVKVNAINKKYKKILVYSIFLTIILLLVLHNLIIFFLSQQSSSAKIKDKVLASDRT